MATGDKKRAVMTDDINNSGSSYPVLGPTGDGSNVTAAFTAAVARTNISTGEKLSVIFGKVAKWFTDLGAAAFRAVDATPTAGSTNLVESGGVKSALMHDLANIVATGTTNTTGAAIASGTYFYLNGTLVQAIADIAVNATFTLNTNYKVVTTGGLNSLKSLIKDVKTITLPNELSAGISAIKILSGTVIAGTTMPNNMRGIAIKDSNTVICIITDYNGEHRYTIHAIADNIWVACVAF